MNKCDKCDEMMYIKMSCGHFLCEECLLDCEDGESNNEYGDDKNIFLNCFCGVESYIYDSNDFTFVFDGYSWRHRSGKSITTFISEFESMCDKIFKKLLPQTFRFPISRDYFVKIGYGKEYEHFKVILGKLYHCLSVDDFNEVYGILSSDEKRMVQTMLTTFIQDVVLKKIKNKSAKLYFKKHYLELFNHENEKK